MISLIGLFFALAAGTLVLLYLKRRKIMGWMKLIAGNNNTSAKMKKPVTDPNYTHILQQRFENGEITEAEYEKMKNELG